MTDSARATRATSARSAHRAPASSNPFDPTMLPESDGRIEPGADEWLGRIVGGRYRVNELLGEGGMGKVYSAEHIHMRKRVALKLLHREMTFIPEAVARFEREAVAAARIAHPHVATALDFGRAEPDGQFYLALEFVEGRSLRTVLEQDGNLPVSRIVEIVRQVAEALQAAHAQGVVHRDLKPDNIMLVSGDAGDAIKVLDFGIAKVSSDSSSSTQQLTRIGAIFGTPEYMSPEQAAGRPVDHKSDLYALGVILYEMLTGMPPFVAGSMAEVLSCHLQQEPAALPHSVPTAVGDLTFALLAKDPADRPESAADVVRALRIARLSALPAANTPGMAFVARKMAIAVAIASVRFWHRCYAFAERLKRRVDPTLIRIWSQFTQSAFVTRMLETRVSVGSRRVSVAAVALGGLAVFFLVLLSLLTASEKPSSSVVEGQNEEPTSARPTSEQAQSAAQASDTSLAELLAVPVYKRSRVQWLTLGGLYEERQAWKDSVFAYRNALQLAPELKDDANLLQRWRRLSEMPEVYEAVLNVALNLLGTAGMDLVYDLWLSTRDDEAKQLIAEAAAKSLMIHRLRAASPALRALLELQFMGTGCDKTARLVKDALKHADERIVPLLKAQTERTCGKPSQAPCIPCVQRANANLAPVIAAAGARKAPRFTAQGYVKK